MSEDHPKRPPIHTYGLSLGSVILVLAIRLYAWQWLHDESPFLFFIAALALSAWFGGFLPGLCATALSAVCVAFYFLPPFAPAGIDWSRIFQILSFCLVGLLISWLMSELHKTRTKAEKAEQDAAERAREAEAGKQVLDALMNYVPLGIAIVDGPEGQIRRISNYWCTFIGQPRSSIEGTSLVSLLDHRHEIGSSGTEKTNGMSAIPLLQAIYSGKALTAQEWSLKRADGTDAKILCSAGPIQVNKGTFSSGLVTWHDITERYRAEKLLQETHDQLEIGVQERTAELARVNQELQKVSSELLTAQETERIRISHELHDDLGQSLTLIRLRLGLIEMGLADRHAQLKDHCEHAFSIIDTIIENVRRLSHDLCPSVIESTGLTAALERMVAEFRRASQVEIHTDMDDINTMLSIKSSIMLYRVFQESLNNIIKHAEATKANFSAKLQDGLIHFIIRDNGKGMDLKPSDAGEECGIRGLGLAFMKERVRTLGGSLEIWSQEGVGTRLSFSISPDNQEGN